MPNPPNMRPTKDVIYRLNSLLDRSDILLHRGMTSDRLKRFEERVETAQRAMAEADTILAEAWGT